MKHLYKDKGSRDFQHVTHHIRKLRCGSPNQFHHHAPLAQIERRVRAEISGHTGVI
jgi:hypothetical protein